MRLRWLALKNVRLLHPSLKFRKISIFLAFSGSFSVKNDNIHTFFSLFWLQTKFAGFAPKQKYMDWSVSMEAVRILQNPDRERTNQSTGIYRRRGLPYHKKD